MSPDMLLGDESCMVNDFRRRALIHSRQIFARTLPSASQPYGSISDISVFQTDYAALSEGLRYTG